MSETAVAERISGGAHTPQVHDSAHKHVSGEALYIDDMPEIAGTLSIYVAQSTQAHARLTGLDLAAVRTAPGVRAVLTPDDIPGENDASPVFGDDPIFAEDEVVYAGQSIFAVAADTVGEARRAADLAKVSYETLPADLTVADAMASESFIFPPSEFLLGEPEDALAASQHRLQGRVAMGGQDHFYLEGHIAYAIPGEDDEMTVWSSTQHPTEVQHNVAKMLAVPDSAITVKTRRMGGGFGGKESQPSLFASIAALGAHVTGRPCKLRLDRDDDMIMTGKRHDFEIAYDVGFDAKGQITGITFTHASRFGCSADLSAAVADRAMCHAD
ncbi:MAG: molybdopterin cofactor-binding domain-containing protein, partial [Pseudomonadota bacterium]